MKYYSIGITEDLNLIGSYPQIEKEDDYNLSLSNSYWNVTWERSPDFIPNYKIRINDKAKITNLLSNLSGFYGLTVDENLKNLLYVILNIDNYIEKSSDNGPINYDHV